jgi:DNA polymerase III delta prime subunit
MCEKVNNTKKPFCGLTEGSQTAATKLNIHQDIYAKLAHFVESKSVPHLIFHGPSGGGKRTIVIDFLRMIYPSARKDYVMYADCARGKGIKFIRDEVKFFARTNLDLNDKTPFKTIVLSNADKLTTDAQSALRRLIEVYSHNTRFIVIVEDESKVLRPIRSRLSEVFVPLPLIKKQSVNLHRHTMSNELSVVEKDKARRLRALKTKIGKLSVIRDKDEGKDEDKDEGKDDESDKQSSGGHLVEINAIGNELYNDGYSASDVLLVLKSEFLKDDFQKSKVVLLFDKIRSNFRSEPMLISSLLYLGLVRCERPFDYIGFI